MVMALADVKVKEDDNQQLCDDLRASLAFHPNVLLEGEQAFDSEDSPLSSLAEVVYTYGALPEGLAIELITRVAHVLSNLHSFPLLMGDSLEAGNILLDESGTVKLRIPTEVFDVGVKKSTHGMSGVTMLPAIQIRESQQQAIERDIRLLGALFCFALFGEDATPLQQLDLRQLETTWEHESNSLPEGKPSAFKSLIWRMIRAGYAEGYRDMQTVVIDLWELGIVSFSHK